MQSSLCAPTELTNQPTISLHVFTPKLSFNQPSVGIYSLPNYHSTNRQSAFIHSQIINQPTISVIVFTPKLSLSLLGAGSGAREDELMSALQILLERLNSGQIPINQSMYEQLQKGGTGGDTTTTTSVNYTGQVCFCVLWSCAM